MAVKVACGGCESSVSVFLVITKKYSNVRLFPFQFAPALPGHQESFTCAVTTPD
jgi:hypothetical protein